MYKEVNLTAQAQRMSRRAGKQGRANQQTQQAMNATQWLLEACWQETVSGTPGITLRIADQKIFCGGLAA